jgi:hypothetical protein
VPAPIKHLTLLLAGIPAQSNNKMEFQGKIKNVDVSHRYWRNVKYNLSGIATEHNLLIFKGPHQRLLLPMVKTCCDEYSEVRLSVAYNQSIKMAVLNIARDVILGIPWFDHTHFQARLVRERV